MIQWMIAFLVAIAQLTTAAAQPTLEKTLLWQVTGRDIQQPSYLYGTIHMICPADMQVSDELKKRFESTRALFLEIKTDDPMMMLEMIQGVKMKDTSTLKGLVGQQGFDSISTIFKRATGMPLELLNQAKPIIITSMVYPSLLGCTPASWEKTFEDMAKTNNMPLFGLEKLKDQMEVLDQIPYHEQADMMQKLLYNLDSARQVLQAMIQVYNSKDIAALYALATSDKDFGTYENAMLIERNQKWIPVMVAQARHTPTFFACGAAHLAGPNGVINLLRKEGYNVTPVFY